MQLRSPINKQYNSSELFDITVLLKSNEAECRIGTKNSLGIIYGQHGIAAKMVEIINIL